MSVLDAFLETAAGVPDLIRCVADEWDRTSALQGWTVGGLTGHLSRAVTSVGTYLSDVVDGRADVDAAAYFRAIPLGDPDIAGAVLERGREAGAVGPERLAALVETEAAALARSLTEPMAERVITVLGGRTIRVDEYLRTRCLELVVHREDLAASVTHSPPTFPAAVNDVAVGLLVELARGVHGDSAVIATLARSERAGPIAVF